jgi:hypothetical protein
MICEIPKQCNYRKNNECGFLRLCQPIVEACVGCAKVENDYCKNFIDPAVKWSIGGIICPMATHIKAEEKIAIKLNPLKQSKRALKAKQSNKT